MFSTKFIWTCITFCPCNCGASSRELFLFSDTPAWSYCAFVLVVQVCEQRMPQWHHLFVQTLFWCVFVQFPKDHLIDTGDKLHDHVTQELVCNQIFQSYCKVLQHKTRRFTSQLPFCAFGTPTKRRRLILCWGVDGLPFSLLIFHVIMWCIVMTVFSPWLCANRKCVHRQVNFASYCAWSNHVQKLYFDLMRMHFYRNIYWYRCAIFDSFCLCASEASGWMSWIRILRGWPLRRVFWATRCWFKCWNTGYSFYW